MTSPFYLRSRILLLFVLLAGLVKAQNNTATFDRNAFYNAMAGQDGKKVKAQLDIVQKSDFDYKEAFEGALLMKKAGLSGDPAKKLSNFKEGHKKLENAIKKDEQNAELRFLRLIIQENAPKFLGYHNEIQQDSSYITDNVKNLDPVVQQAIIDYSKKSKVLKLEDQRG